MKNLKDFQENKAVLTAKGGKNGDATHSSVHKPTRNNISGLEDTRMTDQADVEGKGLVGSTESCVEYSNGVQKPL